MKKKILMLLVALNILAFATNLVAKIVIGPVMHINTYGDPKPDEPDEIDCDGSGEYKCIANIIM